jgi:hypothetical protein
MEFLRFKSVKKTRKKYRCFACGDIIEIGSPAVEWVCAGEGTITTSRLHEGCFILYNKHCSGCRNCNTDDGYWEGFMYESMCSGSDCEPAKYLKEKEVG